MMFAVDLADALSRLSTFATQCSADKGLYATGLTSDDLALVRAHLDYLLLTAGPEAVPIPPEPFDTDALAAAFDHLRRFADFARSADLGSYAPLTLEDLGLLIRAGTEPIVSPPPDPAGEMPDVRTEDQR